MSRYKRINIDTTLRQKSMREGWGERSISRDNGGVNLDVIVNLKQTGIVYMEESVTLWPVIRYNSFFNRSIGW